MQRFDSSSPAIVALHSNVLQCGEVCKKMHPLRHSNPQSSDYKSDALSIRPRGPVTAYGTPSSKSLVPQAIILLAADNRPQFLSVPPFSSVKEMG